MLEMTDLFRTDAVVFHGHLSRERIQMSDLSTMLLEIWPNACRHTDIATSTAAIAGRIARLVPVDHVGVLGFDWARSRVQHRSGALGDAGKSPAFDRTLEPVEKADL